MGNARRRSAHDHVRPVVSRIIDYARWGTARDSDRLPGMISIEKQSRLNDQLMYGCITPEQYARVTRINNPPPGVDPAVWGWLLKPVTLDSRWAHEERVRRVRKYGKKKLCRMMRTTAELDRYYHSGRPPAA